MDSRTRIRLYTIRFHVAQFQGETKLYYYLPVTAGLFHVSQFHPGTCTFDYGKKAMDTPDRPY